MKDKGTQRKRFYSYECAHIILCFLLDYIPSNVLLREVLFNCQTHLINSSYNKQMTNNNSQALQ